jgi:D-amino-acid dehydrogenase
METSFTNGGQLSASNAEVWNSRATIIKGLRWMFTRQIPHYRANTIETVRLAIAAREHLFGIAAREGIDFDLERRGILHFYAARKEYESALKVNALLREGGLERRSVTPDEIRSIEPALHGWTLSAATAEGVAQALSAST